MRVLALWLPQLPINLALRNRASLAGRPVILLQGHGDEAVNASASCEAMRMGVLPGMSGGNARGRCPGAVFLADNAAACLDELERIAMIIRHRATTRVAIGGRDHLVIAIQALDARGEAAAARRLASLVEAWSGNLVRAGVADTRAEALEAAHASRRAPVVAPIGAGGTDGDAIAAFGTGATLGGSIRITAGSGTLATRSAVIRLFTRLQTLLEARGESYREVRLEVEGPEPSRAWNLSAVAPLHSAGEALALLGEQAPADALEDARGVRVSLARLGPDVRVARLAVSGGRAAGRIAPGMALRRAS